LTRSLKAATPGSTRRPANSPMVRRGKRRRGLDRIRTARLPEGRRASGPRDAPARRDDQPDTDARRA
jgi:hypothetical protein